MSDTYEKLVALLQKNVKSAHITDEVDDGGKEPPEGERAKEIDEEVEAVQGEAGVTEDSQKAEDKNPDGNVPEDELDAKTTQPVPPESPNHPTNKPLADTQGKSASEKLDEISKQLIPVMDKLAEGLLEEEDEEEPETVEEAVEDAVEEAEEIEEIEDEVEDEDEDEDEEEAESEDYQAGKEAAEAVAGLAAAEQEAEEAEALDNFMTTVMAQADKCAHLYTTMLNNYIAAQPDEIRKEAGMAPLPPEAMMAMGPGMGEGPPGLAGAPGMGSPEEEVSEEELLAILEAIASGEMPEGPKAEAVLALLEQAGIPLPGEESETEPEVKEEEPAEMPVEPNKMAKLAELLEALKNLE